jgi:hypothetical protein
MSDLKESESVGPAIQVRSNASHLIHLGQRPFPHLLQRAYFACLLLSGQIDFSVPALTDLCDNVELLDLELRAAFSQDDSFAPAVRLVLLCILRRG